MSELNFKINLDSLTSSSAFAEASREELCVLVALISLGGRVESVARLAAIAKISKARASSAVTYWSECEVLVNCELSGVCASVVDEFENSAILSDSELETSLDVARNIRDENLEQLLDECAALMGKPALNTQEVKHITALYTQYNLSVEYILTLAADIFDKKKKLTAIALLRKAENLLDKGIDNVEELQIYISSNEKISKKDRELKRIFEISRKALADGEKEYFYRWTDEYGFSEPILRKALDITRTHTKEDNWSYMDKILKSWHEAGCKTLSECLSKYEADRPIYSKKHSAEANSSTPKYSNFDSEDALMRALQRSYGNSDDEKQEV